MHIKMKIRSNTCIWIEVSILTLWYSFDTHIHFPFDCGKYKLILIHKHFNITIATHKSSHGQKSFIELDINVFDSKM